MGDKVVSPLPLRERLAFKELERHFAEVGSLELRDLFTEDPSRGRRLVVDACGIYLDYSKNRLVAKTVQLLVRLAEESGLVDRIEAMFRGEKINVEYVSANPTGPMWLCERPARNPSWSTGRTSCPQSTRCWTAWESSLSGSATAAGGDTLASPYATSSTSGSGAPTWVR